MFPGGSISHHEGSFYAPGGFFTPAFDPEGLSFFSEGIHPGYIISWG